MAEIDRPVLKLMADLQLDFELSDMILRLLIECQCQNPSEQRWNFGAYRLALTCQHCDEEEKTTACADHFDRMLKAA